MGQNECSFVLIHCFLLCLFSPSPCCFFNLKRGSKHTTKSCISTKKIICVSLFPWLMLQPPTRFLWKSGAVFLFPCNPTDKRTNEPEQKHNLLSYKSTLTAASDATENEILLPLQSLDEATPVIRNSDKSYLYNLLKCLFFPPVSRVYLIVRCLRICINGKCCL